MNQMKRATKLDARPTRQSPAPVTMSSLSALPPRTPAGLTALQSQVGNRAVARLLARAPASDRKGGADKSHDVRNGLSPREMWKLVEDTRGLTSRVPPHAVAEADSRLAQARQALEELRVDL